MALTKLLKISSLILATLADWGLLLWSIFVGFYLIFKDISATVKQVYRAFFQHPIMVKLIGVLYQLKIAIIGFFTNLWLKIKQSFIYQRLALYAQLTRLDKPIGILLLLWPTLIALWVAAQGVPKIDVLLIFVAGVILMRSSGCAINDYADRKIDAKVKRTKLRPLASGKISKFEALFIFGLLSLLAFALVFLLNPLSLLLSFVGIVLVVSYPFMKRYHYLPQVHLGAAFGWAVPMAYAAQANELNIVTWLIFFATVLWATVYDTMYAMVDYNDDIKIGVKSSAILFGNQDKLIIGVIQALLIFNLILIGHRAELSGFYFIGVTMASCFALYQQFLIKDRVPALCFKAFLNNNWFGFVLFVGVVLEYQFGHLT